MYFRGILIKLSCATTLAQFIAMGGILFIGIVGPTFITDSLRSSQNIGQEQVGVVVKSHQRQPKKERQPGFLGAIF